MERAHWEALDAAPGSELLVVHEDGRLASWGWDAQASALDARPGGASLPEPERTLYQLAPVRTEGAIALWTLSPRGAELYLPDERGSFSAAPALLARRARNQIDFGAPRSATFVDDVDADGNNDLLVPLLGLCELWLQGEERDGLPQLQRSASVVVESASSMRSAGDSLSQRLSYSLAIPRLRTEDLNGDGRPDLLVTEGQRHAFHLQREEGGFAPEPDLRLDLELYRDTSPGPALETGEVLGGNEQAQLERRDLNGDGIPDHVIAHRRKVWVFLSDERGPQFQEPSTILKVADEVTVLALAALDEDELPDLLLIKLIIPTVAEFVLGLVRSWEVSLRAIGYRNVGEGRFDTTPAWRRELSLRLPAILDLVRDPEAVLERFERLEGRFRTPALGDVDGDGQSDLALVDPDGRGLGLWRGEGEGAEEDWDLDAEAELRGLLFEGERTTFDLDSVVELLSRFADQRHGALTAGREADARMDLGVDERWFLRGVELVDVDGDGAAELCARYARRARPEQQRLDVWRLP